MILLLDELPGRPDRNTPDLRVAVDELVIIYGYPPDSMNSGLNGKEGFVLEDLHDGWFLCSVVGYENDILIKHENLMYMDEEDLLVINGYDK